MIIHIYDERFINKICKELLRINNIMTTRWTKAQIDNSSKYVHKTGKKSS